MRWQVACKFYTKQATSGILEENGSQTKSKYLELSSPHLLKTHSRAKERGAGGLIHLGRVWAGGGTTLLESQAPQTYPSPSCLLHPLFLLRQEVWGTDGALDKTHGWPLTGTSTWPENVWLDSYCLPISFPDIQGCFVNFLDRACWTKMKPYGCPLWVAGLGVTEIAFQKWNDRGLSSPQHLFHLTFCLLHVSLASHAGPHFIINS